MGGFNAQLSKAFFAICTALSKSDFEPSFTSDSCSPVAGLNILPFLSDFLELFFHLQSVELNS